MGLKTVYCVQPYWRDGSKLAHGELSQFRTEKEARKAARRAYDHHAGVLIYSVRGCPEFDAWRDPRPVAQHGDVPALEF